ncbi:hypothetical protein IC3_05664 [Bacillus cereus VD142]|nr:hypothetical protein IC3_05664 [Bacillus cereus VD142]
MLGQDQLIFPAMLTFMIITLLLFNASLSFIIRITEKMMW